MRFQLKSTLLQPQLNDSSSSSSSKKPLATPLQHLNECLHGGIPPSTVTELYGLKSTFKTQFILTLAVQVALGNDVVIIADTDSTTHTIRLLQIAYALAQSPKKALDAISRIFILPIPEWPDFTAFVHLLPSLIAKLNPSFIAIDSMSTLFRTCLESSVSKRFEATIAKLRHYASLHNLHIVLTNGARTDDDQFSTTVHSAMGENWKYVVGTRLYLHRQRDGIGLIRVIKSGLCIHPHLTSIPFQVNAKGIVEYTQSSML